MITLRDCSKTKTKHFGNMKKTKCLLQRQRSQNPSSATDFNSGAISISLVLLLWVLAKILPTSNNMILPAAADLLTAYFVTSKSEKQMDSENVCNLCFVDTE